MKTRSNLLATAVAAGSLSGFLALSTSAAVRYVDVNSVSPTPPFTNWATAATILQDAIDAAMAGDEIVVTNGVYQTGGRAVSGTMTNRVAVDKPLTVRSVNGSEVTVIRGYQVPGTTNGDGAVRCVYLTNEATLVGFTLTNGATRGSAGHWEREQGGGGLWSESTSATISNCVLTGNSASFGGGGAYLGTLNNCTLTGNSAYSGGGADGGTLNNCTLTGNSADYGGGIFGGSLNNCTLTGNAAGSEGGGSFGSKANNCTLTGNSAYYHGGGAYSGILNNCTLRGNMACFAGGGAYGGTLNSCTLTGNSASYYGGGASGEFGEGGDPIALHNCIVYYNTALHGANYSGDGVSFDYCCTTPLPYGIGNLAAEPQLASASHLSANSPCRGAGSPEYVSGVDLDDESWANPPAIGCDEPHPGAETGPLNVAIKASFTNVATGFEIDFTAQINGNLSASVWEFGDGTVVSNRPYATHSWPGAGDYSVVVRAYNQSFPAGVSVTVTVQVVSQPVHYVAADSGSPAVPYNSWATAATSIQEAVDVATVPGALVLVSNGVYQIGGRAVDGTMTNRVAVTKPLTVRSVNGPEMTVIRGSQLPGTTNGDGAVRCVYLMDGAALVGFTLTNGATRSVYDYPSYCETGGGGVWCESAGALVSNCVVSGNSAGSGGGTFNGTLNNCTLTSNSAYSGGGAYDATLDNCTMTGNSAADVGGGAYSCALNNCTLTSNSAYSGGGTFGGTLNNCSLTGNYGGGAFYGTLNNCILAGNQGIGASGGSGRDRRTIMLNNCIVYYNSAGNCTGYSSLSYCCTTPLPPDGAGNFTNSPLFVDQASGNFRLQANSPCINAGRNAYAPASLDLDGHQRIVGGTVDVGAYEFQLPQSAISYTWLQQYGLPTDGLADFTDNDSDGLNNWQEWRCLTDPTNALSVLRLLTPASGVPGVTVRWESVTGRNYFLERGTHLGAQPLFLLFATDIGGQAGTTTYLDTNAVGAGPFFYRVGVLP